MQLHVELLLGIYLKEPVSKEDTELLIKMASGYLHGVGGTPHILASMSEEALYISVSGMEHGKGSPPIRSEQLDQDYARNSIVRSLREAGLIGTKKKKDAHVVVAQELVPALGSKGEDNPDGREQQEEEG